MKTYSYNIKRAVFVFLTVCGGAGSHAQTPIIAAGDPVVAIDEDLASNSAYPAGEFPNLAVDGSSETKYLNFGRDNSGFIITPVSGPSVLRSFAITTANDAPERDPASVIIYGTNMAIVSTDNSGGAGESWTSIAEIRLALSEDRFATMVPTNVTNDEPFASYKFVFSSLKGPTPNSMQIAEVQAWDEGDGRGQPIFAPADPVLAIHEATPESSFPLLEAPGNLFDGSPSTKYLNFGRENSGFIVTPSVGPTVADSFILTTANDFPGRDPVGWKLYGTNAAIVTENNGTGRKEPWTLIGEGQLDPPFDRFAEAPEVFLQNSTSYTSYKFLVTAVRDPLGGADINSTQYSKFQLFGSEAVAGEIVINDISVDRESNEVTIIWDGPAGGICQLESSLDLVSWSEPIASGLEVEKNGVFTFQPPAGNRVFYRLLADPAD